MDAGFGAPLLAQDGQAFKHRLLEFQKVDEHCTVQRLPRVIPVGFVRRQKVLTTKVGADLFAQGQLLLGEFCRINGYQVRQT